MIDPTVNLTCKVEISRERVAQHVLVGYKLKAALCGDIKSREIRHSVPN